MTLHKFLTNCFSWQMIKIYDPDYPDVIEARSFYVWQNPYSRLVDVTSALITKDGIKIAVKNRGYQE